ncbi:hypothetical protein Tco_0722023 [Tanacetum coccineum]
MWQSSKSETDKSLLHLAGSQPMLQPSKRKWISDKRTKNQAKTDKTEHGMEERDKVKVQKVKAKSKSKSTLQSQSKAEIWVIKGLLDEAKEIILGMEISRTQSGNSLRRVVCERIVMKKRIVRGHEYMTLTGKLKDDTWLKGLSAESGFKLRFFVQQGLGVRTRYSGANLSLLLLYILTEQAHAKSGALSRYNPNRVVVSVILGEAFIQKPVSTEALLRKNNQALSTNVGDQETADGDSDRDAEYKLSKLLQIGTVAEYQDEFEKLINRVTGISESLLKSFYISGLKLDLQCLLFRSNPKTLDDAFSLALAAEARFTDLQLLEFLRSYPSNLGEAFFRARITKDHFEDENNQVVDTNVGDQEDPDVKNKQENQDDPNIAIPDQVLEESILHTSDKVKVVSTSMVATYEEHGCQDGFCMVATYEEHECQDGLKPVTTRSSAGKKGDLGAITSKGGPPDHIRASEKELVVLKVPLEQKSMFRRQDRMLR